MFRNIAHAPRRCDVAFFLARPPDRRVLWCGDECAALYGARPARVRRGVQRPRAQVVLLRLEAHRPVRPQDQPQPPMWVISPPPDKYAEILYTMSTRLGVGEFWRIG